MEEVGGSLQVPNLAIQAVGDVWFFGQNTVLQLAGSSQRQPQGLHVVFGFVNSISLTIGTVDGVQGVTAPGAQTSVHVGLGNLLTVNQPIDSSNGVTPNSGAVHLIADDMALNAGLLAGAGLVFLQPSSSSRSIDLGGPGGSALGLTDAELDRVTATWLWITSNGDIAFNAPIDAENHYAWLELRSLGPVVGSGGAAPDVTVADLQITSASIGTSSVPLRIAVGALATGTFNGDQFLAATGTVKLGGGSRFIHSTLDAASVTLTSGIFQAVDTNVLRAGLRVQGATFDIGPFNQDVQSFSLVDGTIIVELLGTGAGQVGSLRSSGAINLNNATLDLQLGSSFAPGVGSSFTILHADSGLVGTFAGLPEGSTINKAVGGKLVTFTVHYTANDAVLTVTSSVNGSPPAITSAAATTFFIGSAGSFTVMATGSPPPTLTESGTLPTGVTFDPATGILSGTPAANTAGTYPLTFAAGNGFGPDAVQAFTLTVPPVLFATGADAGGGPDVRVFDAVTHQQLFAFFPYDAGFTGGVRVAVGDVNEDGTPDVITAPGPGGGPDIHVYDGSTGQLIRQFFAYDPNFTGGVYVAAGDVNGDGFADIICGADGGGGPNVTVFSGKDGSRLLSFFPYDPAFTGGVRVAAGDVHSDGVAEIVTGAGPGGGPNVTVYRFVNGQAQVLQSYFAYDANFTAGVYVATGDVNGDGRDDVVVGAGAGGGPNVAVFDGVNGARLSSFFAFDPSFTGGVRVAAVDRTGTRRASVVAVPGPGGGPDVRALDGLSGALLDEFFAYAPAFTGGLYVAAGR